MNKKIIFSVVLLGIAILGFSNLPSNVIRDKSSYVIPDTPEAKEIMKTIERAYDIEAEAAFTFDIKNFPEVFINDPRYPVDSATLDTIRELTNNSNLETAGWLDYKTAFYTWRIESTIKAEKIKENAKQENRALTKEEVALLVDVTGRVAPAKPEKPEKKIPITFLSVDINEDIAIVILDDGTYVAELTLVFSDGKWYIAAFRGISLNA